MANALSTRPTDAELVQLLRLTHTPLTDLSLSCGGCGETWPCLNVQAADALEPAQETAPPMSPARAAEVQKMYARAEAATAIVTAAVQWRKYPTKTGLSIVWQAELQTAIDCYNALPR